MRTYHSRFLEVWRWCKALRTWRVVLDRSEVSLYLGPVSVHFGRFHY